MKGSPSPRRALSWSLVVAFAGTLGVACDDAAPAPTLDEQLSALAAAEGLEPLPPKPMMRPELVDLGRALFFDKELSGNRDVACATCHHPSLATGDALSLSVGVGGVGGLGQDRYLGEGRLHVARNAPEVFNRGYDLWTTMFWDKRVQLREDGSFLSPAGEALPGDLTSVLAVQAMFPPTSVDEMRGLPGDVDVFGATNEIAARADDDLHGIWSDLMARLVALEGYRALFRAAYPTRAPVTLGFEDAANALAAYQIDAFTFTDAPWDRYLRGDLDAMTDAAKRGALLFYGEAGCASCHSGPLLTDQEHYSVCAPQIGPGKGSEAPWDLGVARETGRSEDRFAFRTPPLRNVAITGPWMHDGAYTDLEAAVRHQLDPAKAMMEYRPSQLREDLWGTLQYDEALLAEMLETLDPVAAVPVTLSDDEVADLLAFLDALTDPAAVDLGHIVPDEVPSGLPVDHL